ncbi:hypothetical protein, partial [Streptomyces sp. SID10115]
AEAAAPRGPTGSGGSAPDVAGAAVQERVVAVLTGPPGAALIRQLIAAIESGPPPMREVGTRVSERGGDPAPRSEHAPAPPTPGAP